MHKELSENWNALKGNSYPGRGIVIGRSNTGELIQVYWIMGRKPNSRNRIFVAGPNGSLSTEAADPSKMSAEDAKLTIYPAMLEMNRQYIVSNGHQTSLVCDGVSRWGRMFDSLRSERYEPDAPHYTPRITAILSPFTQTVDYPIGEIAILRKSEFDDTCERHLFTYENFAPGVGYCVHTYAGDGDPLPSFHGEPYPVPLIGDSEEIATMFREVLNQDNLVSLAVKRIDEMMTRLDIYVFNKYEKVAV